MTKDEAMKQALEAWQTSVYGSESHHKAMLLAMTNMAQARSAPVQEPVAWMGTDIEGNPNKFRLNPFNGGVALYKKPQSVKVWDAEGYDALMQELELWKAAAQRQWVGLTDEEIEKACVPLGAAMLSFTEVARAIEAKLRSKNNG
jgi:hypothetical protein